MFGNVVSVTIIPPLREIKDGFSPLTHQSTQISWKCKLCKNLALVFACFSAVSLCDHGINDLSNYSASLNYMYKRKFEKDYFNLWRGILFPEPLQSERRLIINAEMRCLLFLGFKTIIAKSAEEFLLISDVCPTVSRFEN